MCSRVWMHDLCTVVQYYISTDSLSLSLSLCFWFAPLDGQCFLSVFWSGFDQWRINMFMFLSYAVGFVNLLNGSYNDFSVAFLLLKWFPQPLCFVMFVCSTLCSVHYMILAFAEIKTASCLFHWLLTVLHIHECSSTILSITFLMWQ